MPFSHSSKGRLTDRDLARFASSTLFHRLARAVCHAGCLPRKELYEAWEVARRVRRLFRGGRVVDLGGGHGLLAQAMLLLDDTSRSDTYPTTEVDEEQVKIGHEATVSKVSDEQLFYLQSRGITKAEAETMIVNGFIEPFTKELPIEYAVELNRLIQLEMIGSVG